MTDIMRKVRIVDDGLEYDDIRERVPISYAEVRNKCIEICRNSKKTLSIIGIVAEAIEELTGCYLIRNTYRKTIFFNSLQAEILTNIHYRQKRGEKDAKRKETVEQNKQKQATEREFADYVRTHHKSRALTLYASRHPKG